MPASETESHTENRNSASRLPWILVMTATVFLAFGLVYTLIVLKRDADDQIRQLSKQHELQLKLHDTHSSSRDSLSTSLQNEMDRIKTVINALEHHHENSE